MSKARKSLSIREFAAYRRARGLLVDSSTQVHRLLDRGVLSRDAEGKLDPAVADAELEEFLGSPGQEELWPEPEVEQGGDSDEEELEDGPRPRSAAAIRRDRDAINLELAKLELARKRGELLEADAVERDTFAIYRRTRDRILAVPARVAAKVHAAASIREAEIAIEVELRAALEELADAVSPPSA